MKQKSVPGYRAFFGTHMVSYEELLYHIPPQIVISIAIDWLNELNAPLDFRQNQHRILNGMMNGFNLVQQDVLLMRIGQLERTEYGPDASELIHKRYLHALIARELTRQAITKTSSSDKGKKFHILLAYLIVIDEVHEQDRIILEAAKKNTGLPSRPFKLLWPTSINQFQYNERLSPLFELFKMVCLLNFCRIHYRDGLSGYLKSFPISSIGFLLESYRQMVEATMAYDAGQQLSKLSRIITANATDALHLRSLCINPYIGRQPADATIVKKKPLFADSPGKFRITDPELLYKHIYRGPYFDLKNNISPETTGSTSFSRSISKQVIEKKCFRTILDMMKNSGDELLFDDDDKGAPDASWRHGNVIILFEMKAYILGESVFTQPDYQKLVDYLEENLVRKGASQLHKQIIHISKGTFAYQSIAKKNIGEGLTIYPIVVHDEFHFGLNGINSYITERFREFTGIEKIPDLNIRDVTMIHLQVIFDFMLRGGGIAGLYELIDRYREIIAENRERLRQVPHSQHLFDAESSFDEVYSTRFIKTLPDVAGREGRFGRLLQNAGITQEVLSELM